MLLPILHWQTELLIYEYNKEQIYVNLLMK